MNPFIKLAESPVTTLTAFAYVAFLIGLLIMSWWALGRNLVYLDDQYQNGWKYLVPFWYTLRAAAMFGLVAVDLLLIAGIIHVLVP